MPDLRRPALLAALAGSLVAILASAPLAMARRQVPHGFLGMMADGPLLVGGPGYPPVNLDREFAAIAASGAETLRVSFEWNLCQPYASFHDPQFLRLTPAQQALYQDVDGRPTSYSRPDYLVSLAARHGLTVLPVVVGTPRWAGRYSMDPGSPPAHNADYARFLASLVRRYRPHGSFHARFPIRRWVIWNEPVLSYFWGNDRGQPAGLDLYVSLLHSAYTATKRADPKAQVILAGLPPALGAPYPWHTLAELYRLGARPFFDAVAVHPFTFEVSNVIRILQYMRNVMAAHGDRGKPLLATEISWGSAAPDTEATQASKLAQAVPRIAALRHRLGIENLDWYTWTSFDMAFGDPFDFAGLSQYLTSGRERRKPAYYAWTRVARRLEGCVKLPTGSCR